MNGYIKIQRKVLIPYIKLNSTTTSILHFPYSPLNNPPSLTLQYPANQYGNQPIYKNSKEQANTHPKMSE